MAERIKALKAANTVEATPERTGTGRVAAEEPVTSRIRRRAGIAADQPEEEPTTLIEDVALAGAWLETTLRGECQSL